MRQTHFDLKMHKNLDKLRFLNASYIMLRVFPYCVHGTIYKATLQNLVKMDER